ncbi:MAG: DUF4291 domain-containing protein [Bifidobacteriaceae bacterium]|jgi:hypothetical protein|nr:DUF4291 domain-containing protein [Bifidobacteriaceae bacterium]
MTPWRQIRAVYDDSSIVVYQAYSQAIAGPAVAAGRFVAPFSRERMTWIKPSFYWMMYRSGWARKPGQERVLAIRLSRAGFEEALSWAVLSHFDPALHDSEAAWRAALAASPVRIQWDPERSATLEPLPYRSLQMGLSGPAVERYVDDWTLDLTDVTPRVHTLAATPPADRVLDPPERPYPLPDTLATRIGATPAAPTAAATANATGGQ